MYFAAKIKMFKLIVNIANSIKRQFLFATHLKKYEMYVYGLPGLRKLLSQRTQIRKLRVFIITVVNQHQRKTNYSLNIKNIFQ